jgi:hypothetical protein
MPALPAAFMMPGELARDAFRASIFRHHCDVIIRDALHNPLTFGLKLKKFLADILRRGVGRVALEDALRDRPTSHAGNGNGNIVCHSSS